MQSPAVLARCHAAVLLTPLREKARSPVAEDFVSKRSEQPKFLFLQHCLFCGEKCAVARDPKHPDRWHPAYVCREEETFGNMGLREQSLKFVKKRMTHTQSEQVRVRMGGVLTDLHAADVRHHVDCKATFMSPKSICSVNHRSVSTELNNSAFVSVVK